jgi:bifunctional DNA-binding transcriptional regulator/antitoxin component of YhaV-PrlF toxin-antitoxin module
MEQQGMVMIVRMAANGVLTIPSPIRRKLGMMARTRINMDVDERNHIIVLTPITHMSIQGLRGRYKGKGLLKALKAEKENRK